jgi:hypothetical protein
VRLIIHLAAGISVLLAVLAPGSILSAEQPARTGNIPLTQEEFERALSEVESPLLFRLEDKTFGSTGTVTLETEVLADRVELRNTSEVVCRRETITVVHEETTRKDFLLTLVSSRLTITTSNSESVCDVWPMSAVLSRENGRWRWVVNGQERHVSELDKLPEYLTSLTTIYRLVTLLPCDFSDDIQLSFLPFGTVRHRDGRLSCRSASKLDGGSRACGLEDGEGQLLRLRLEDCNELVQVSTDRTTILRRIRTRDEP